MSYILFGFNPTKFHVQRIDQKLISTSIILLKSHYDSLGISPKATQADVKTAYYKLSKIFHPDRNQGCSDASRKFQEVSNAYEVLGNYKLRKLYDKGLLHTAGAEFAHHVHDEPINPHPHAKFYESRQRRETYSGKTPIYDFDEWSRMHYEETFDRRNRAKQRWDNLQERVARDRSEDVSEKAIWTIFIGISVFATCWYGMMRDDWDVVKKKPE